MQRHRWLRLLLAASVLLIGASAQSDELPPTLRAHAVRRTGELSVDGHLHDPAWSSAPRQHGFIQRYPVDGQAASFDTSFAILYDDNAVYIGVWADDSDPTQIRGLLTRRDTDAPADVVIVAFDTFRDLRSAYAFQLNAAGVQRDILLFDDTNQDDSWDAVWTGDAVIGDAGWTAEFRIPLSQLRYTNSDSQEWGFQIMRFVARTQELSTWSPAPRSSNQMVSRFGIVDGLEQIKPVLRVELLPYATVGFDARPVAPSDPLNSRVTARGGVGLDVKYGLGPSSTLAATVNPDFGQVEADPSQVNLTGNELFLAEKRPFFVEGIDLFKLPIGRGDSVEGAFYSRRIGATPADPTMQYQYLDKPSSSTIYGAAKFTGKTNGWSIGLLEAVTAEERGRVINNDNMRTEPVLAPLTNYAVGHIKRDFGGGGSSIGISATAVDRDLEDTALAATLPAHAYTVGAQVSHRWWDNAWQLDLQTITSLIQGSKEAIANEQQQIRHLYQRPDATHLTFDPTRRTLSGSGATWIVGRRGDVEHWRFALSGDLRTPGLELNDLGYQTSSDHISQVLAAQYREDLPGAHVLNWQVGSDAYVVNTFEPTVTTYGWECNAKLTLVSYWGFAAGCKYDRARWDPVALRGGPALRVDPNTSGWLTVTTDTRRSLWFMLNGTAYRNDTADSTSGSVSAGATIQARSNIDIFVGPGWSRRIDPLQYVTTQTDAQGLPHYVLGTIHQTTANITARVNWTFSRHLSLQAYAQPFLTSGRYSALKEVTNPHAERFADRFAPFAGLAAPDFNFRQLRSTMTLRWEYAPGSSVFVIWSRDATSAITDGDFDLTRDLSELGRAESENLVMVKLNYWMGL